MNLDDEIILNQYAQSLVSAEVLLQNFDSLPDNEKGNALNDIINLIIQSKVIADDINIAIDNSGLKSSFTPCVLLQKGVDRNNLYRIAQLPGNELNKVFVLFINLFSVAYKRRYDKEKGASNKWWYWDLSDPSVVGKIKKA